jgi:hypothetical protein
LLTGLSAWFNSWWFVIFISAFDFGTDTSLQQISGTQRDACDFARQTIEHINVLVGVFRNNPSNFLEESWNDFKGVR